MTEAEWLVCEDPKPMFHFLRGKKSRRKQRLFACACCRLAWDHIPATWCRAVEVNESYADGAVSQDELSAAVRSALCEAGLGMNAQAASFACHATLSHLDVECAAFRAA